jgi:hypothetical protein
MKNCSIAFIYTPLLCIPLCGQTVTKQKTKKNQQYENKISKPENPYYSNTDTTKLHFRRRMEKVLPEDVYEVTRNADTERPFTGKYWNTDEKEPIIVLAATIISFWS